jgi:hypothetical protein
MENTRVVYVANTDHEQQLGGSPLLSQEPSHQLPDPTTTITTNTEPVSNQSEVLTQDTVSHVSADNMSSEPPFIVGGGATDTKVVELEHDEGGYESSGSGVGLNLIKSTLDDDDDDDDNSSICTDNILKVDPIYIKLSKFLQTSEGENVCNILEKILHQLEKLNENMKKQ